MTDFENVLLELREKLDSEFGPNHKPPSPIRYKTGSRRLEERYGGLVRVATREARLYEQRRISWHRWVEKAVEGRKISGLSICWI